MFFNNSFYIASHRAAINFLFWTSYLFFSSDLITYQLDLTLFWPIKSSAIHWLTRFQVSSGLFLVLFWMLWMLVTVHKLCHVSHASRITTCGAIFTERHFSVSKEWARSWSYAFLITYHKRLITKVLVIRPEKVTRRKKRKKTLEWQLQSFLR